MWRQVGLLLAAGLAGCNSIQDNNCTLGRSRYVAVKDSSATIIVNFTLAQMDPPPDIVQLDLRAPQVGDSVTGVHLHLRTPGMPDRMVLDLTRPDLQPGPGIALGYAEFYSFNASIENLMMQVRSGMTYLDVHLSGGQTLRYDITNPQFSDWSSNCGLD
jgi:hypothetical protein